MKIRSLFCFSLILGVVLFSYTSVDAQVVDEVKKVAEKTKEVTVDTAKKTGEVTGEVAEKTKDAAVKTVEKTGDVIEDSPEKTKETAEKTGAKTKEGARMVVQVTDNLAEPVVKKGRLLTVTTWDGTKWVSKKVWFSAKKSGATVKKAVTGSDKKKP
ncbi:MAG: hypothetical protein R2681_03225 [Pyrinomonadaceae bacterium]